MQLRRRSDLYQSGAGADGGDEQGLEAYYDAQGGSAAAVAFGDKTYGSLSGNCGMTAPGYYCDGNYDNLDTSNGSVAAQKWEGFSSGMAQQWTAVWLGGVAAARRRLRLW